MLKTFLKRMKNMKLMRPFTTWLDLVGGRKGGDMAARLNAEKAKRMAAMADMAAGETAKRLKLHFARLNGKFKDMCFKGWANWYKKKKMSAMAEGEKYKRLRVFLEAKMKGLKYATFRALHRENLDLKKRQMGNNAAAQKVGKFLEMIARGLVARLFSAFKRFAHSEKMDRMESERLAALIANSDNAALQRLKIFLGSKVTHIYIKYGRIPVNTHTSNTEES